MAEQGEPIDVTLGAEVVDLFTARQPNYDRYRAYMDGTHAVELTDRMREFLRVPENHFSANLCPVVVDAMADRLIVTGFESDDEPAAWAQSVWEYNRMDETHRQIHHIAGAKGDAFLIADWDPDGQSPTFRVNEPDLVRVKYDPADLTRMLWAAKRWRTAVSETRLNVYWPDRIEKYLGGASFDGWRRFSEDGDAVWPVPWTMPDGEPIGVPIVHFANRRQADRHGISELRDLVPIQNAINKTLVDLLMSADTQGWPQRYTVNAKSPSGALKTYPGAIWDIKPQDDRGAQVGQFEAAALEPIAGTIQDLVGLAAGITRTPQHMFELATNYPSGEALKTAESGLVHKVIDRQVAHGNSWEDVLYLGLRIANANGFPVDEGATFATLWAEPHTRNEEAFMRALESKQRLGVTQEQIWREMGYDQGTIERMKADMAAKQADEDQRQAEREDAAVRRFNAGAVALPGAA